MRVVYFIGSTIITITLVVLLSIKLGSIPPVGKFLSPQQGFWQNAEPVDLARDASINLTGLHGKVKVYFDDRLVPHVFADNDDDAYFIQGYLHAKFRLWQMDFQTRAASGRLCEVLGNNPLLINYDRLQRRMGMVYAAQNHLKAVAKDAPIQKMYDSYTAGVNAFINSLSEAAMPLEYKLLDYKPQKWTNLQVALLIKLMASDLAGQQYGRDMAFSNEKAVFTKVQMDLLYPDSPDSLTPIIPAGSAFLPPIFFPVKPASADSLYFGKDTIVNPPQVPRPVDMNGSNNWAVSGSKTQSGAPILCNDPHLRLSFPSIWYEMQLTTPTMNVYGVSLPAVPGIVIGFNDNIAFGMTNAGRDVMDYYKIRFRDESKTAYWYNGKWEPTQLRIEKIKVRGGSTLTDTVAYTVFGPVTYDRSFTNGDSTSQQALAMRWIAHDPSDESMVWYKLNRAKSYTDYEDAVHYLTCPAQNMIFASTSGDIALWQQGKFPARWEGQGLYVMPGEDSTYQWQGYIPFEENPHLLNPAEGFIESANQRPVDSTYPYFIPGDYISARGRTIYKRLSQMQRITPNDMMLLQSDTYNITAADAVPVLLKNMEISNLSAKEKNYLEQVRNWNFSESATSTAATIYHCWLDSLKALVWRDEFQRIPRPVSYPPEERFIELLQKDSLFTFIDNINTPAIETLPQQVTAAFQLAAAALVKEEKRDGLVWWKHKNSSILHLLRESVLPFGRTGLQVGGWSYSVNALTKDHGPSWRMVVELSNPIKAYGVYPAGEEGNPGSKYYDNFVDTWASGSYYTLWMMKDNEANDKRVMATITFTNS
jgi:penicillin G amidase